MNKSDMDIQASFDSGTVNIRISDQNIKIMYYKVMTFRSFNYHLKQAIKTFKIATDAMDKEAANAE